MQPLPGPPRLQCCGVAKLIPFWREVVLGCARLPNLEDGGVWGSRLNHTSGKARRSAWLCCCNSFPMHRCVLWTDGIKGPAQQISVGYRDDQRMVHEAAVVVAARRWWKWALQTLA